MLYVHTREIKINTTKNNHNIQTNAFLISMTFEAENSRNFSIHYCDYTLLSFYEIA